MQNHRVKKTYANQFYGHYKNVFFCEFYDTKVKSKKRFEYRYTGQPPFLQGVGKNVQF